MFLWCLINEYTRLFGTQEYFVIFENKKISKILEGLRLYIIDGPHGGYVVIVAFPIFHVSALAIGSRYVA